MLSFFTHMSLCPSLKCRNPSTVFYRAFRPSRLHGSKPFNDRYGSGCAYLCACVAWIGWLNQAPLITLKMSSLSCHLSVSLFQKTSTINTTRNGDFKFNTTGPPRTFYMYCLTVMSIMLFNHSFVFFLDC